jgi:ribosome-associated heat shock protein Hsp15
MKVRIDKYLHAVRIFKTRSLSSDECRLGKISVNSAEAKASRDVQAGDIISIRHHGYTRTIKVIQILEKRVGAALVEKFYEDITPEEEIIKKDMIRLNKNEMRERGSGRPTKKERRIIDNIKGKQSNQ